MKTKLSSFYLILVILLCNGCAKYFNQPSKVQDARLGEPTEITSSLKALPKPANPLYAGVYRFRDQTGQYKAAEGGSTFSTAVTQGATSILIKAMEDSGWFIPIERENVQNLYNERQLILGTRQQFQLENPDSPPPQPLAPLLYSDILLEGGIVSYDANIITGGFGLRYFGAGGSTKYRQDRVTVYLRAVSVQSGKILKTVYISKTILSQALDGSFFRFVKLRRLLEAETGFTYNEPSHMAVTEAIEKALESLIIEGMIDDLWAIGEDKGNSKEVIDAYLEEKAFNADTKLYDRLLKERRSKAALNLEVGSLIYDGDFANSNPEVYIEIGYEKFFNPNLSLKSSASIGKLSAEGAFEQSFVMFDGDLKYLFLPYDDVSPFLQAGIGMLSVNRDQQSSLNLDNNIKAQYGAGVEYLLKDNFGLRLDGHHNLVFSDEVDGTINGKRDDYYWKVGLSANVYLGKRFRDEKSKEPIIPNLAGSSENVKP